MKSSLKCFYDLHVSPSTYDFFTFLISAEICRIRRGYSSIILFILKGPNNGFRLDSKNRTYDHDLEFLQNVILPGISLLPSCNGYFWSDRYIFSELKFNEAEVFPRGYLINRPIAEYIGRELVTAKIRGDKYSYFISPNHMKNKAELYFQNNFPNKKIVTLTSRELVRGDPNGTRSIKKEVWENVSEKMQLEGYQLLIIRDTEKAFEAKNLIENIPEIPMASLNISYRLASYEKSFLNFVKSNGPGILHLFSKANSVYFNEFDNDYIPTSEEWYKINYGMIKGCNFPMTTNNIDYKWDQENVQNVMDSISKIKLFRNKKIQINDFINSTHLKVSINVAVNHLITCMKNNVLYEDLLLIYQLEKLRKRKIIENKILDVVADLEGKVLKKGTIDKIIKMDRNGLNKIKP